MVKPFDRLLLNPDECTFALAVAEACRQVSIGARPRLPVFAEIAEQSQGRVQLEPELTGNHGQRYLVVAWWTDHQGRRHVRICSGDQLYYGRHLHFSRRDEDPRPPLWHVHPERIFHVCRAGEGTWLASCACGVTGPPEQLAWMGPCCGPCHDRREEGDPLPCANRPAILYPPYGPIYALAFSPDGETLAVSSACRMVNLHDLRDGRTTGLYADPSLEGENEFHTLVFSPDGNFVAAGDREYRLVRLWRCDQPQQEIELDLSWAANGSGRVTDLAFSPDGQLLAACLDTNDVCLWEGSGEKWGGIAFHPSAVTALSFSPDSTLALGEATGNVTLYDTTTAEPWVQHGRIVTDAPPNHEVHFVQYTPQGSHLVLITGSPEPNQGSWHLRLWDLARNREERSMEIPILSAAALSPDGRYLAWITHAAQHSPAAVTFHDLQRWQTSILEWDPESDLRSLAFSPDGQTLATGSGDDGIVKFFPWRLLLEG